MLKRATIAVLAATACWAAPAAAQNAAQGGVLVIYGDDKCPTNQDGDEIVVCRRLDESERYRIPQDLREPLEVAPDRQSWAVRQEGAMSSLDEGVGSCSAVGVGGASGCFAQQAAAFKAERRQQRRAEENLPLP